MKRYCCQFAWLGFLMPLLLAGCGDSNVGPADVDAGIDAGTDAGSDAGPDTDTDLEPEPVLSFSGQLSGGGRIESANYSMKVSIGSSVVAQTQSIHYRTSLGLGALLSQ